VKNYEEEERGKKDQENSKKKTLPIVQKQD